MRILVVGAGALGGYYGGRLLQAGRDVTFLVRPARAACLAETGLAIKSRFGDVTLLSPKTVLASELREHFDLVILGCKSYDLDGAIDAFAPAVGAGTVVVPLLNGMRHLDVLDQRLGSTHVLGGACFISATMDNAGRIVHLGDLHRLSFGERRGGRTPRVEAIAEVMSGALFEAKACDDVLLEMWGKWVFLATLAGMTCLMRSTVGDIVAAGGADLSAALSEECQSIAIAAGYDLSSEFTEKVRGRLADAESTMSASMLRDLELGGRTEADHILGDLLRRRGNTPTPDRSLLRIAYTHLKAAEARTRREKADRAAPQNA
jgi:2-dehydropantoate 2-reductase